MWKSVFAAVLLLSTSAFAEESATCRLAASYRAHDMKAMQDCAMRPYHRSCQVTVGGQSFYGDSDSCGSPSTGVFESLCAAGISLPETIIVDCWDEDLRTWKHVLDTEAGTILERSSSAHAALTSCNYISTDERIVRCGDAYDAISNFVSRSDNSACASFYAFGLLGTRFASVEEAAARAGCDTTCIWHYSAAIDGFRCGRRWGYSTLTAESTSCPTLYNVDADGFFTSLEEYVRTHPCQ